MPHTSWHCQLSCPSLAAQRGSSELLEPHCTPTDNPPDRWRSRPPLRLTDGQNDLERRATGGGIVCRGVTLCGFGEPIDIWHHPHSAQFFAKPRNKPGFARAERRSLCGPSIGPV